MRASAQISNQLRMKSYNRLIAARGDNIEYVTLCGWLPIQVVLQ